AYNAATQPLVPSFQEIAGNLQPGPGREIPASLGERGSEPTRKENQFMTVQEFQARKILRIAQTLAHFVATTPAEKLDWCPCLDEKSCTRSVLDQIRECVACNRYIACLLGSGEIASAAGRPISDAQTAQEQLLLSAEELAAMVRVMPEESLAKPFTMPAMTVS